MNGKQFLLTRRILLAAGLVANLGLLFAAPAAAQGYPSRPVKIITRLRRADRRNSSSDWSRIA